MILSLTCHIWNSQCMSITNVHNLFHTYLWSIPNVCTLLKFQQININIFIELNKGRRINYLTFDKFLKWSSSISFLWVITKEETIAIETTSIGEGLMVILQTYIEESEEETPPETQEPMEGPLQQEFSISQKQETPIETQEPMEGPLE